MIGRFLMRRPAIWWALLVLAGLVAADLALMALHVAWTRYAAAGAEHPIFTHYSLQLTAEDGLGEFLQYAKLAFVVGVLVAIGRATEWRAPWAWATVFGWVLVDDAVQLHERGGALLVEALDRTTVAGIGVQDLGELLVWGVIGAVLVPLVASAFAADGPRGRRLSLRLLATFALLAAAGGAVDVWHALVPKDAVLSTVLAVGEDGGELLAVSFAAAVAAHAGHGVLARARTPAAPRPSAALRRREAGQDPQSP